MTLRGEPDYGTPEYDEARRECRDVVEWRDRDCRGRLLVPRVRCRGPLDVHEILTRQRGGSTLDPENCALVCRAHHDWVHANTKRAEELGLLEESHA